jgi:hypothetical protein
MSRYGRQGRFGAPRRGGENRQEGMLHRSRSSRFSLRLYQAAGNERELW